MAGIWNGPIRGGTRGGKDKFKWDDVKTSADREYYLGHSVMASAGRWQKGKDLNWMNKTNETRKEIEEITARKGATGQSRQAVYQTLQEELAAERRAFNEREEELRLEALGLKPRRQRRTELDEEEKEKLLKREGANRDESQASERVEGLGFAPSRAQTSLDQKLEHARSVAEKVSKGELDASELTKLGAKVNAPERLDAVGVLGPARPPSSASGKSGYVDKEKEEKKRQKQEKKEKKRQKKNKKRIAKLAELDAKIAVIVERKKRRKTSREQ